MALVPRPRSETKGSAATAEGKKDQRKRNKESPTGHLTRSGSSGSGIAVRDYPGLEWSEVSGDVNWLCDIAAKMSHVQIGATGIVTASLSIPREYVHALVEAQQKSTDLMVYLRVYNVSSDLFTGQGADDGDE